MGRSLAWYILPKTIEHDATKQLCLDLKYEPEKDSRNVRRDIYNIVHPNAEDIGTPSKYDTIAKWAQASRAVIVFVSGGRSHSSAGNA